MFTRDPRTRKGLGYGSIAEGDGGPAIEASEGGASRFFWVGPHAEEADLDGFKYAAKAHPSDRDDGLPADVRNTHPTVKPLPVARWLARLVGTDDGVILDCFSGSGTTARACLLEGFACVAIERDPEYAELSRLRAGLAPTEAIAWIRLRDRLREATVPRKRSAKARPTRPPSPGVALIKAWGAEGRAACVAWLDATGGDARVAPVPSHMSEWSDSFTPPAGHPTVAPAPARAALPPRGPGVLAELREARAVEILICDATDGVPEPAELTIAALDRGPSANDPAVCAIADPHSDAAPAAASANPAPEIPTDIAPDGGDLFAAPEPAPEPTPPAPARSRRKRRDEGLRAAVRAATTAGDPEGPDGAELLADGPGREAEVLAAAAFGPEPVEVEAAIARGRGALARMPGLVSPARLDHAAKVRPVAQTLAGADLVALPASGEPTGPRWVLVAAQGGERLGVGGLPPRAVAPSLGKVRGADDDSAILAGVVGPADLVDGAAPQRLAPDALETPAILGAEHKDLVGVGADLTMGEQLGGVVVGGGVHGKTKITEPAAGVKPTPAIFIAPAERDPWDDLPPMFAPAPRRP